MIGNGGGAGGWMFFGFLMMVGVVLLVVVVVRVIAGGVRRGTDEPARPPVRPESEARRLLDERYARGELSTEEYQERLRVLGQRD